MKLRRVIALTLLTMLLVSSMCAQASSADPYYDHIYFCDIGAHIYNCKEYVSLRSRPSSKASVLERVWLGENVRIQSRDVHKEGNADYAFVRTDDGNDGYILIQYLQIDDMDSAWDHRDTYGYGDGIVTATDANCHTILRTGPGTNYPTLGYLFGGEVVPYLGHSEEASDGREWYYVELEGSRCWVSSKYTTLRRP